MSCHINDFISAWPNRSSAEQNDWRSVLFYLPDKCPIFDFSGSPVRMSQLNAALIDHLPKWAIIGPLNVPSNLQEEESDHRSISSREHSSTIATLIFSLLAVGSRSTPRLKKLLLYYRDISYLKARCWEVRQIFHSRLLIEYYFTDRSGPVPWAVIRYPANRSIGCHHHAPPNTTLLCNSHANSSIFTSMRILGCIIAVGYLELILMMSSIRLNFVLTSIRPVSSVSKIKVNATINIKWQHHQATLWLYSLAH